MTALKSAALEDSILTLRAAVAFTRHCVCMWPMAHLTPHNGGVIFTLSRLNPRCQKPPCRAVTTVGVPRQFCLRMRWRCTSNRSPWLTESRPRRSSSSSCSWRANLAKRCPTTRRWRETAALGFALAAPQTTKTVVTHQSHH